EHFFSRTALMYIYMGHMKYEHTKPYEDYFWKKNRIDLVFNRVENINVDTKTLHFKDNSELTYDKLILAVGSKPNKFGWPGQDLKGVSGLYSKQDLELVEQFAPDKKTCKRAVIVGGGLIGIELAEMLRSRDIPVTFLVREKSFWNGVLPPGESAMINEHILEHHIDLRLGVNLEAINDDGNGKVKSIIIKETGEEIACDYVGLTAGVSPNIDFLKASKIATDRGILVNKYLETNIDDVYAIGDCAQQQEPTGMRRPIEAVWYTGRMMGEVVAQSICGRKTAYKPGHWFNSAKFLDIEYQTYGWVFAKPQEYEAQLHWRHPEQKICVTLSYHKGSHEFLGINTFGIRMRHEIFDAWLTQHKSIDYVIEHLSEAMFDPEFFKTHTNAIQHAFAKESIIQ
ncbi:MAG: FAD-dependent oxidoreductase, partial [Flavobacteriaceae bacterium]|nr:FAD-dependent oxidoreductase [Flavobacteriaceae bacterium]